MKNVTISMDDELLEQGRAYAQDHSMSFNALMRLLLRRTVEHGSTAWVEELVEQMESSAGNSHGRRWQRDDLYDG